MDTQKFTSLPPLPPNHKRRLMPLLKKGSFKRSNVNSLKTGCNDSSVLIQLENKQNKHLAKPIKCTEEIVPVKKTLEDEILKSRLKEVNKALKSLYCPLTKKLPKDPVVAEDGYTYNREKIVEWIKKYGKSPLVHGMKISEHNMVTNKLASDMIKSMMHRRRIIKSKLRDNSLAYSRCESYSKRSQSNEDQSKKSL